MSSVLLKISGHLNSLSPSEQAVGRYIQEHPEEAVGLSIGELAENSGTSKAAIIRFCKALNYTGYRNFAIELAGEMAVRSSQDMQEYTDIKAGDDMKSIIRNVCLNNIKAMDDSLSIIDYSSVEKAAAILAEAQRIDFFGSGASGIAVMDAQQKFIRIGKFATAHQDPHLQITSASNLDERSAAVAISWSGQTRETLQAASAAKESGARLITITKLGNNPLSSIADVRLQLTSPETTIRSGAMSSRIAQLNMVDILYSLVVSNDYNNIRRRLDKSRNYIISRSK